MFKLSIECGNAAFDDLPGAECARILRQIADKIQEASPGDSIDGYCHDFNGNRVGEWSLALEDSE